MNYVEYLNKETELDIQLASNTREKNSINLDIDNKTLELNSTKDDYSTYKRDIRSKWFERFKQKLYLRAVNKRIEKVNKKNRMITSRYVSDNNIITKSEIKSIIGGQVPTINKKYYDLTSEVYSRLQEVIRNDITRYVLYRNQKSCTIVEITANIKELKKNVKDTKKKIDSIKAEIKRLKQAKKNINKALDTTVTEMFEVSDEFTREDVPKVKVIQ